MSGKKWKFDLTHILLFSILTSILSLMHHPAQDALEENAQIAKKKREKAAKEEKSA